MKSKQYLLTLGLAAAFSCFLMQNPAFGQKKNTGKTVKEQEKPTASSIPKEEMETYRQQATQIVKFLESTLNLLADKQNTVREKETIINDSYQKFFWDSEVQVEDDLDTKRLVPLYKDVQAYLTDVDFFFKGAKFDYQVQDVSVLSNHAGQTFFKVTANRSLKGLTLDGDSVNSNQVRYIEINYDGNRKQIKIVSIYTTKLNEKEDLRNWWNGLSQEWRELFGSDMKVDTSLMLSQVDHYNDTVALVDSIPIPIPDSRIYGLFLKIVGSKSIDLSGNSLVTDLEPLTKLSNLTTLNLSHTPVVDLSPLRNLNALENLNIGGTQVTSLDPLKYCNHVRDLNISGTDITDISVLTSFPNLEVLDISHTGIGDLKPLAELTRLRELRMNYTRVSDLTPLAGLKNITLLDFSSTPVTAIATLANLIALEVVTFNDTKISSLEPLAALPVLRKIYCDQTEVKKDRAVQFMIDHPGVVVSFASVSLDEWWKNMSPEWQKIFFLYRTLDNPPTREQLHLLMTIDSLNISGRSLITTLSPLTELPRLRWLDCSLTGATVLDPLKDLLNLTSLNIRSTGVASVEPLSALARLVWLNLDDTKVSDISPLTRLQALKLILADNSGVTKEEAIDFMEKNPGCLVISQTYENTNWWKTLPDVWQEVFRKVAGFSKDPDKFQLQQIADLKSLVINGNPSINDLQPVVFLSRLEELRFSDTRVTSLQPLIRMSWLRRLGFPKNAISDLTPLSNLTQLVELDGENTQVEDLRPIQPLVNLEILKLSGTPVKNLKEIAGMRKLEVFDVYNTKISNIDVLNDMRNLKSIKIFNTRISEKRVEKFKAAHPGCEVVYY
ncbi:MAG: leucine-rich repeat domain-containing protein [Bacteroidetes bacterium]|nr:MAG: leucine-rich repeat domain-containing protein [Bacteroidota bacterium]